MTKSSVLKMMMATLALSLTAWPVGAQTVQVDGLTPNAVLCLNNSTGQNAVASVQGEVANCSQLPQTANDAISIIISGISGGTPPPPGGPCTPLVEVEPADPSQLEGVGDLAAGGCLSLQGSITGPLNPDGSSGPNTDIDGFGIESAVSSVNVSYTSSIPAGQLVVLLADTQGNQIADCSPTPTGCQATVPSQFIVLLVAFQTGSYTIEVRAASGSGVALETLPEVFNKFWDGN